MPVGRSATAAAQSDAPPRKPPKAIAANEKRILGPGCVNISASAAEMTKSAAVAGTKAFFIRRGHPRPREQRERAGSRIRL